MTNDEISNLHRQTFESIKRIDEAGHEYWLARELSAALEYSIYRHFLPVVERAKQACEASGYKIADHMEDVRHMVDIGSGAKREVADIRLSRYACYLIVQNGDPSKPVIALGQTYFAIQTRRQELQGETGFQRLSEDQRRLMPRGELSAHNKALSAAARQSGVETALDYAVFQDHGYRGLYGGLGAKDIHARKGLKKSHKILDHMGSTELAANLFRATQTEDKLRRDAIVGKVRANAAHLEVGRKVRKTIQELGGQMPEDLPAPRKSIQEIERSARKALPGGSGAE